jgi:hypothetical protein
LKHSIIKSTLIAMAIATTATLAACGGGGGKDNKPNNNVVVNSEPKGFANIEGSCYINVALQVIANDPALREEVIAKYKYMKWSEFFAAYDGKASTQDLATLHTGLIEAIRALKPAEFTPNKPGYVSAVLRALQIGLVDTNGLATITTDYPNGKREFDVGNNATQKAELLKFEKIPLADKLSSFVYFQGSDIEKDRHFIAYVLKNGKWFKVNDAEVNEVTEADLKNLKLDPKFDPNADLDFPKSTGINIISYR